MTRESMLVPDKEIERLSAVGCSDLLDMRPHVLGGGKKGISSSFRCSRLRRSQQASRPGRTTSGVASSPRRFARSRGRSERAAHPPALR